MKPIALIAGFLLVALMLFLTIDLLQQNLARKRAQAIRRGDTKLQVRRLLGNPSAITTSGFFDSSESWAYGGYVDWPNLMSSPVRVRLFGPDSDEVSVRFNSAGKVDRIIVPKR